MRSQEQEIQLLGVNLYNWTIQVWDEAAKSHGVPRWSKLESGFQRYLLEKMQDCTTKDEVKQAMEAKE